MCDVHVQLWKTCTFGYRRSRNIKNPRGIEENKINRRAGAAARAKKASEAADQMEVARVVKPMGLRISVAGSSFIVSKNTRAAPATMPGVTNGSVTEENTPIGARPKLRAASSIRGLTWSREALAAPTAGDK